MECDNKLECVHSGLLIHSISTSPPQSLYHIYSAEFGYPDQLQSCYLLTRVHGFLIKYLLTRVHGLIVNQAFCFTVCCSGESIF